MTGNQASRAESGVEWPGRAAVPEDRAHCFDDDAMCLSSMCLHGPWGVLRLNPAVVTISKPVNEMPATRLTQAHAILVLQWPHRDTFRWKQCPPVQSRRARAGNTNPNGTGSAALHSKTETRSSSIL